MRLWHVNIIQDLPRAQLLGQHRECCALRGKGWGKKHIVVDYVFKYSMDKLESYHSQIIHEMLSRGYKVDPKWEVKYNCVKPYEEHNSLYLLENLLNLERKGISMDTRHWEMCYSELPNFTELATEYRNSKNIKETQKKFFQWSVYV